MPAEIHIRRKITEQWCFALLTSCFYVFIFGYQFNNGDQAEHLPQVYQKLNPSLYPNDFFLTLYHQTFTVRFYWVELVTLFSRLLPISIVCFSLYMICLVLCIVAWIKITEHITGQKWAAYLTVIFIFIFFNRFTVGGNQLQGTIFVGSNLAEAFASFGILFFLKEKYKTAAILLAIASLFQVLVGFHLWILFSSALFFSKNPDRFKQFLIFSFIYLIAAMPILLPLLSKQFFVSGKYDENMYYRTVYIFRSLLHFKPTLFPLSDYIKMLLLFIPACILLFNMKSPFKRILAVLFITIVAGAIVYALLIDGFGMNAAGKIQWFKTMVWLNAFCCLILAARAGEVMKDMLMKSGKLVNPFVLMMFSLILLLMITNGSMLPFDKLKQRYQIGNYEKSDLQLTHEWIRNNTPVDAMFLVSPQNDAFACEAQRPQPVNFKAVVHEPFYFTEWYNRIREYYNVDFEKVGNNSAIIQAENNYRNILKYPQNNEAQFRIDNVKQSNIISQLGEVVFKKGDWIMTKINKHD